MKKITISVIVIAAVGFAPLVANASPQGRLSQTINAGVLSTDIVDASNASVTSPSFGMSTASVSTSCQTITGTYGSATQRVAVDNPGAATAGWTLSIAATGGDAAQWTSGGNTYAYNNPAAAGCTGGQLTLNPAAATLAVNGSSTITGVTKGTSAAFASGTVSSVTLMTASAASDDIWNGYLTGIGVSQVIPAETPAGTYVLDLTQTLVAS